MATRDQMMQALRAADAAGNIADAQQLARSIQALDAQPKRGALEETGRTIGQFGHGLNDSIAEGLGAIPDVMNWAARASGIYPALGLKTTPWGFYPQKIKQGMEWLVPPPPPAEGTLEKAAYGAGHGVGDAASIAIPAAAMARTARAGSLLGTIAGGLAAQPAAQAVSGGVGGAVGAATDNPLLGLAASLAVPASAAAARRMVSPVVNRLTPEAQRLARVAAAEGIPLDAGQQTGSRPLQSLISVLDQLPLSAGRGAARQQTQRDAWNRAVLRHAGINSTTASPDVLDQAGQHLQGVFQSIAARTTVNFDRPLLQDLHDAITHYSAKLPSQQRPVFHSYINDILQSAPQMSGRVYQQARSDLSRQARALLTQDPTLSQGLRNVRDALDEAFARSVPPNLRDDLAQARRQYGNWKIINKAMTTPGVDAASGNIPPAAIWRGVTAQRGVDSMARGRGDLNDLSRVGQAFIKQQVPNSGTPERSFWMKALGSGMGALPFMGAAAGGGSPSHMLIGATAGAAGLATPAMVQAFIHSPAGRAWLTNQAARNVGPRLDAGLLSAIGAAHGKSALEGGQ